MVIDRENGARRAIEHLSCHENFHQVCMGHSCVENYIHLIFATRLREDLILSSMESRLHSYLCGIARKRNSSVIIINGTANHLHLLLRLHPTIALSTLVKELKSYSTGWMKKQDQAQFSWQVGYGGFSVSHSMLEKVSKYIECQKEHHQKCSFNEEIESLISRWHLRWSFLRDDNVA
ncbi:IS200/IS605 family transposase [Simkania negevensis]|uniref:IS200/IS605 family transposase n=1 Tax=Simkania negevensis TaxID=83561 RepID=A0ABS3AR35_9BACT|nr:IS200/IS605 family transposase [Simkania negevensis]